MNRKLYFLLLFIASISLAGCGSENLSEKYDEDKLRAASERVIVNMNEENYEAVLESGDEELKSSIDEEKLKEAWSLFESKGSYNGVADMKFSEREGYAVVEALADYEERDINFRMSYNEDMELSGIWMR